MSKKSLEITIPVFNEELELEGSILKLYSFCKTQMSNYAWCITIVDNASTDKTAKIGGELADKHPEIQFMHLTEKGRGRAIRKAWTASNSDICSYMDLDLSTDLKHLPNLCVALENGYDIAIGSRLKKGAKVEGRSALREFTSRTLNFFFIKLWFRTSFTDAQCGFKAVTARVVRDLLPKVKEQGWFFDGELLIVGEKSGYRIYEEPVHWVDNPGSTVRLISTIWGDIQVMFRLLLTRPWKQVSLNRK